MWTHSAQNGRLLRTGVQVRLARGPLETPLKSGVSLKCALVLFPRCVRIWKWRGNEVALDDLRRTAVFVLAQTYPRAQAAWKWIWAAGLISERSAAVPRLLSG
jgi:hypothetical protein